MKRLTQIFQALLGMVALILTALVATGRLAWRTIRNWWTKSSKWFRITIATSLILLSGGFTLLVAFMIYNENHGRSFLKDTELSNDVKIHFFNDDTYRVYNRNLRKYTTPKVDWIYNTINSDTLVVYANHNKRGYINTKTGEIVIDSEQNNYNRAWLFSEGLAAVMKDGKIGFINTKNKVIIPFQFDYIDPTKPWSGHLFHNGYCIMTNKDGKMGIIDKTGKWIVEPTYDEIYNSAEKGYRVVVKEGKYGVLDSCCNIIFPVEYSSIDIDPRGIVLAKEGKKWKVDFDGNIIIPFVFDSNEVLYYSTRYCECEDLMHNTISDYDVYEVDAQYGIMNRFTGQPITPAIYDHIEMHTKNLFKVKDHKSYSWYLVDTQGNIVPNK